MDRSRGYNRLLRKSLHMAGGVFAFLLPIVPYWLFILGTAAAVACGFFLKPRMSTLMRQLSKPADRQRGALTGVRAYFGSLLLLGMVWSVMEFVRAQGGMQIVQFGWLSMALGDGLAGLVGPRPGRTKTVPWNRHKTWWGFVGCIAGVLAAWWMVFMVPASDLFPLGLNSMVFGGLAALVIAFVESWHTRLDDNFTVCAAAAILAGLGLAVLS